MKIISYHGTSSKKLSKFGSSKRGIYFTSDPDLAIQYAREERYGSKKGKFLIIKAVLTLNDPKVIVKTVEDSDLDNIVNQTRKEGYDGVVAEDVYDDGIYHKATIVFNSHQIKVLEILKGA